MTRRHANRAGRHVTAAVTAAVAALLFATTVPIAAAAAAQSATSAPVLITVDQVTPVSPARSVEVRPLVVELTLTNRSGAALTGVQVVAERGYPISTQGALNTALTSPTPTGGNGIPIAAVKPVIATIPAAGSVTVQFQTTYSLLNGHGLCICGDTVYPLVFTAQTTGSAGAVAVGSAVTYVPGFYQPFAPEQVSWVWSLLERPHRLDSDTVFEDDDLSAAVSTGGRLDRALAVVEQVSAAIPMTLVLDPETLDELQVMATTTYLVRSGTITRPGTGSAAAAAWLLRLRTVLAERPADQVELTALGDPDVQSVLQNGAQWSNALPAVVSTRIGAALGYHPVGRDVTWPASGRLDTTTLTSLAAADRKNVILDDSSAGALAQSRMVRFPTKAGAVTAALTDSRLQQSVVQGISVTGAARTVAPTLVSRLAIPVIANPKLAQVAVLTSTRYVDPSVTDAVYLIDTVSDASFVDPVSLPTVLTAASTLKSTSRLTSASPAGGVPAQIFSVVNAVDMSASAVHSMLEVPRETSQDRTAAAAVLDSLPLALERLQSSAWRTDGHYAALGRAYASRLSVFVQTFTSGVQIVPPNEPATYTLGSSKSSLPITIRNGLSLPVYVVVRVSAVGSVPGFTAKDIGPQTIDADSTRTVQLPTSVQRSGRIRVVVQLSAPDGTALGDSVPLLVHSTALGRIGVIITITSGILLGLALVVRFVRGLRARRRRRPVAAAPPERATVAP